MPSTLPLTVQETLHALARRRLTASALLLLAGHRPLAFAAGQALALAAPLADLLGETAVGEWAQVLSTPEGPGDVQQFLLMHEESGAT